MPRRRRLILPDVPLHIVQRGNNRDPCFFAEQDYRYYLRDLGELAKRFRCAVHAYVLMTNHVHLLLTPEQADSASELMKHLGQRYVQHVNRTRGRSGTLWEGRFRSSLVQQEDYLLRCQRYIELNPVRAGMVAHPRNYSWSSYLANAGSRLDGVVTPHERYGALGATREERAAAYRDLFRLALSQDEVKDIRAAVNGGFALGDHRFKQVLSARLKQRVDRLRQRFASY